MLTKELAETIVQETMERLNRNINIFDADGIVLASGAPERVGQVHEAALEAIRTNKTYMVEDNQRTRRKGMQAGINLPVVYDGIIVGAVGITGHPEEVQPFGELVKMTTELMLRQQQADLEQNWKQFIVERVLDELLEGGTATLSELNGRLRPVAFALQPPFQVATVQALHASANGETETKLLRSFSRDFAGKALVSRRQDGQWIILFAHQTPVRVDGLLRMLLQTGLTEKRQLVVGVGTCVRDLQSIPGSYKESQAILTLTPKKADSIVYYEDRAWEAVIAEISEATRRKMIDKYKPHLPPKAQETLDCFFQYGLHIGEAARRLGIHRNTMIYRLEQIKADTGCNPQQFRDALTLQLVLWLMKQD